MAGKPKNFQAISNVLASYDFVDIAAGTGIINFYAGNTVDLKLLSNSPFYSDAVSINSAGFSDVAATKRLDIDFDVMLNRPLNIKGKTVVNVPIVIVQDSGTGDVCTAYVVVYVRKWTGSVETDLATNQSSNSTATAVAGVVSSHFSLKAIDVDIPQTHFKIGEYLRLTVEVWSERSDASGSSYVYLGNDPMNRSAGWDSTGAVPSKLVFQCPVRLNL